MTNSRTEVMNENNESRNRNIIEVGDNKNVYKGPCLQAEDNHGVCFIFPVVLWLNFGINYEEFDMDK